MTAPTNSEKLRAEIVKSYDRLSPRLKQVAKYALDNPNDMALQTLAVIADRCNVQPSTIVRFAKTFGYDGASQMQKLFRDEMLTQPPSPSYAERIRQFNRRAGANGSVAPHDVMREFADSNILALEHLKDSLRKADLERAVDLIRAANAVYIVGLRRSFPVASYLAYALRHVDKRAYLLDGVAGMLTEQSGHAEREGPADRDQLPSVCAGDGGDRHGRQRAQGPHHRHQRQPAEPHRRLRRRLFRDQGRGGPPVPLVDRIAVPRADAGHQLRVRDGRQEGGAGREKEGKLSNAASRRREEAKQAGG